MWKNFLSQNRNKHMFSDIMRKEDERMEKRRKQKWFKLKKQINISHVQVYWFLVSYPWGIVGHLNALILLFLFYFDFYVHSVFDIHKDPECLGNQEQLYTNRTWNIGKNLILCLFDFFHAVE